jgi:hypothetical protein
MLGLRPKYNEWRNCKTMVWIVQRWDGEQMFTIKSEMVGYLYWVKNLFKVLTKTSVNYSASQCRNFVWISANFSHSSLRDYHTYARPSQVVCITGSENLHGWARNLENVFSLVLFRAIPKRRRLISQLHQSSNRWWNLGFICECWNQKAVRAVDANTFAKQAEKV